MSWTQYSTKVHYPILSKTATELSYVKEKTILSTREFLSEYNGVIHLNKTYVQHPKQANDVSITSSECTNTTRKVIMNLKKDQLCLNVSRNTICK